MEKSKLFDGKLDTMWHANHGDENSFVLVKFHTTKVINKVVMKKRTPNEKGWSDRYKFCINLRNAKNIIEQKCTEDKFGNPFNTVKDTLEVNFSSIKGVKSVQVKFSIPHAALSELYIHGQF